MSLKQNLRRHLSNIPGWHTNRKIIVFESDDWGSIRMPSKDVYNKCLKAGYRVDLNPYERYDSLASQDDLELLFDLLLSFKDKNNNHPVITANCVVANPDFKKIKNSNYNKYYYELITETFKHYPKHNKNFNLWIEGKEKNIFYPQFHAREHLNVNKFMSDLQINNSDIHFAFKNQMSGIINKGPGWNGNYYVQATKYNSKLDKNNKLNIFLEGLDIFKKLFGYNSLSIIPPNYTWSNDFYQPVASKGVKFIQGNRKMREPGITGKDKFYKRKLGGRTNAGQINLVRNCFFEPTLNNDRDIVNKCLSEISIAFNMRKPAIISTHRINFVGYIDINNRNKTLLQLKKIISTALKRWPDIEFMTAEQLGKLILSTKTEK